MKVCIVGDPHITLKSLDKGRILFKMVEDLGHPTVWLGDLLDTKAVVRGECQNLFFDYFKSSKIQHIILVGNHDYFNLECKDHSLKPLSALPNVKIIDKIETHPKYPFIFFPYVHDKKYLKEALNCFVDKTLTAFGHFDVSGFDYGNGHFCDDGIITHDDFKGFKRVVSGHFHKFQNTGNFMYLGTPFSHSFGEANQDKVIGVYDSETNNMELIKTVFPRHVSIKLDLTKTNIYEQLDKFTEENLNNLMRVQLFGTPELVAKLNKSNYPKSVKWEDKSETINDSSLNVDETLDNKSQFLEWANNIKKLDQNTISLGLSILEGINVK